MKNLQPKIWWNANFDAEFLSFRAAGAYWHSTKGISLELINKRHWNLPLEAQLPITPFKSTRQSFKMRCNSNFRPFWRPFKVDLKLLGQGAELGSSRKICWRTERGICIYCRFIRAMAIKPLAISVPSLQLEIDLMAHCGCQRSSSWKSHTISMATQKCKVGAYRGTKRRPKNATECY